MTSKALPGRIPAETLGEVTSWMLPPVDDNRAVSSAEKEARERREKMLRQGKEIVEDVEVEVEVPAQVGISAQELQEIFDNAEKDGYAQGHAAGFSQGKAEGYETGKQQGLAELRAQMAQEQQRLQGIMDALLNPITAQDNDLENMLLDIICSLTQSVVQRELKVDSSQILALVQASVAALPIGSKNIRVCLNPDDIASLEDYAKQQQLDWTFFADRQLQPGGCRIETPESRVDFSVSMRLQTVLEQFLTGQLASGGDTEDALEGSVESAPAPVADNSPDSV
ncbi:MAG TPA: flagellar assembly protein FliH [Cellvibrio sp.]|nr:flagellar assembly protein FliH [Cellvibrio sp.]